MMLSLAQTQRVETHISYAMQIADSHEVLEETRKSLLQDIRSLQNCGLIYNADVKLFEAYIDIWYDRLDQYLYDHEEKE